MSKKTTKKTTKKRSTAVSPEKGYLCITVNKSYSYPRCNSWSITVENDYGKPVFFKTQAEAEKYAGAKNLDSDGNEYILIMRATSFFKREPHVLDFVDVA